ncbi:hypothetical protein BWD14_13785 [Leptospira santarosai]|uniref:Uncharacterized protein n=1 Tax=Leptospira santarosai TaxID=28183 RepID=A0AB73MQ12_9LEPT|nr:hypothetical protein BWD14_13785 [Leptospira santarosai]
MRSKRGASKLKKPDLWTFPSKDDLDGNVGTGGKSNYPPANDMRFKIKIKDFTTLKEKRYFWQFSKECSMKPNSFEEIQVFRSRMFLFEKTLTFANKFFRRLF